jgi:signal transduction histidine kinase
MNFVDNYRKFTKLPVPILKETNLSSLINNNLIVASTFPKFNTIKLEKLMPGKVFVNTDEKLLSQVIINLLKNACEALILDNIENPSLKIKLLQTNSTTRVEISNNGNKIAPEIREQIFIPFFTTKEKGTGVGLSLSKQIMLKMHGDVILSSRNEDLTTFVIILETV